MRITTERLLIREFESGDLTELAERYRDTDLETPERTRHYIRHALAAAREELRLVHDYALLARDDGRLIGRAGLRRSAAEPRDGQSWFVIDPREWNKGFVTEAAAGLFRFFFEDLAMHRLWGECNPHHQASARVMEKLGMTREAHFRENAFISGSWQDTAVYALLEREWRAARA